MGPKASVVVIGAGTIGSHALRFVARNPLVGRISVIDFDTYSPDNLSSQDISRSDVGRPKARVQARRLKRIRPDLVVEARCCRFEDLEIGALQATVILGCTDSRISRMRINQAAWRLGVAWADAGVNAEAALARVDVYIPSPDACCIECAWNQTHYDALEMVHPCQAEAPPEAPPSNAPAYLGALAGSLLAAECAKLLEGADDKLRSGRQTLIDLNRREMLAGQNRRNPGCRFDHRVFAPQSVPDRLRLGDAFELCGSNVNPTENSLSVFGQSYLSGGSCPACGYEWPIDRFTTLTSALGLKCPDCGAAAPATAWRLQERMAVCDAPALRGRTLRSLGVRRGDLFTIGARGEERHFLLGAYSPERGRA